MAVETFCLVTVTLDSIVVLGVETAIGVDIIVDVPLPEVGGFVEIDILGVTITVPCPSVTVETVVLVPGVVSANLTITVVEAP